MADFKNKKRQFLNNSMVCSLNFLRWAMGALPQWFVKMNIAILTPIVYTFLGKNKMICRNNFKHAYGSLKTDAELDRMIKTCIVNVSETMADLLYYIKRPQLLAEKTHIHNEEVLKKSLQKDKGVVCVSAHMGNFPIMFIILTRLGYKVNVIIRPMRNEKFSDFMFDLCSEWGINMIKTLPKRPFIKETFGALKRNELLFILLDEAVEGEGTVEVDFFNTKVRRAMGPILYHRKAGADVVPVFVTKDAEGEFHIHVEDMVDLEDISDEKGVAEITKIIEKFVQKFPLQWGGWFNKRWSA